MKQNFILCENEIPAYVGDSVRVTVNGTDAWDGVITNIPLHGTSFCLNHDKWFDFDLDLLTVTIIGRKITDEPTENLNNEPKPEPDPRDEIKDLKERIRELEKKSKDLERYEAYAQAADEMAALRQAFVDKGFSKTEAFTLMRDFTKLSVGMKVR